MEPMFQASEPQIDGAASLPVLLVFDLNGTLSDMAPLAARFEEVGAPGRLAGLWFAGLLRDGFALTIGGENPPFAGLAAEGFRMQLSGASIDRDLAQAVDHIMAGFSALHVRPDVPDGLRRLANLGIRMVTLTNGSTTIAQHLLSEADVKDFFESFLSVEQAGVWKPVRDAYAYALEHCGVEAADAILVAVHPLGHGRSPAGWSGLRMGQQNWMAVPRVLPGARSGSAVADRPRPAA